MRGGGVEKHRRWVLKNTRVGKQRSTSEVEAVALALVGELLGAELRLAHEEAVGGEAVPQPQHPPPPPKKRPRIGEGRPDKDGLGACRGMAPMRTH